MKPLAKAVGGKSQVLERLRFPSSFGGYCEPFVGGGAVFWYLATNGLLGERSIIGDASTAWTMVYEGVRDRCDSVARQLNRLITNYRRDPASTYYTQRRAWNEGRRSAARSVFLRQAGFNGLWRENKKGAMNVPWGHNPMASFPTTAALYAASAALADVEIVTGDFYETMSKSRPGDLIYCDPPFLKTFSNYTADGFVLDEHVKLLRMCAKYSEDRFIMYQNQDSVELRDMLSDLWPTGKIEIIPTRRMVNRDGGGRGPVDDVLVTGGF